MRNSISFFFRLLGAVAVAAVATYVGTLASVLFGNPSTQTIVVLSAGLVGAIVGFLLAPIPLESARRSLSGDSAETLIMTAGGVGVGLLFGALLTAPLQQLPGVTGQVLPIAFAATAAYLGAVAGHSRSADLANWFRGLRPQPRTQPQTPPPAEQQERAVLLDTSVIIDGRIADVSRTGFLNATLLVPSFILHELQNIADSPDPIRRKRGRRGLEVLDALRNDCPLPFAITDADVSDARDVDTKLVALARHLDHAIMTNDYNLNRVAGLQGVTVLNINDLANSIKAAFLPGEELTVRIIQEGREYGQGVGYLDDGTMVVVEDGRSHINATLTVIVTKVLQTSAGRMIFARLIDNGR